MTENEQKVSEDAPADSTADTTLLQTPVLDNLERGALAAYFKTLSADARADVERFKPGFAQLSSLIARVQDAGIEGVALEIPNYSALRQLKIIDTSNPVDDKHAPTSRTDLDVRFALLNIYDARFIVRIHPNSLIDCHPLNINKHRVDPLYLDNLDFWEPLTLSTTTAGIKQIRQPVYFTYDLDSEKDCAEFIASVLQITSICEARSSLLQYDRPANKQTSRIHKSAPANLNGNLGKKG